MIPGLIKQLLRGSDLAPLSMQRGQGPERLEIALKVRGLTVDSEGQIVASDCLEDAGSFGVRNGGSTKSCASSTLRRP